MQVTDIFSLFSLTEGYTCIEALTAATILADAAVTPPSPK